MFLVQHSLDLDEESDHILGTISPSLVWRATFQFTYLFTKYLIDVCYVSDPMLGAKDKAVNKTTSVSILLELRQWPLDFVTG